MTNNPQKVFIGLLPCLSVQGTLAEEYEFAIKSESLQAR